MSRQRAPILSTAGAVPIKNAKGEFTMEKVKVQRYVTGKRPDFAPEESSDEEEQVEIGFTAGKKAVVPRLTTDAEKGDRRLQRLQNRNKDDEEDDYVSDRIARHRQLQEPEVLGNSDESSEEESEREEGEMEDGESSDEEELDEEEIERRRGVLRQKMRQQKEEELLDKEEEKSEEGSDEDSSEYEEYTDSEEEETGPRLKPVFVRKKDRITIAEKEQKEQKEREAEVDERKRAEERRKQTLKLVEDTARKEVEDARAQNKEAFDSVLTDEDNDEEEYEAWKVRELKRMKRDREERETMEKEKMEIERLRNMTEEERKMEMKANPKQITNKGTKGKYKYLQKYYHRGAFFMDEEEHVYTRDFSAATLEDHFDKTTLPKVKQVKNFGRSGRTKYTHLVDQDTTQFDSPWTESSSSLKFHNTAGGGMRQTFDRPSAKGK